MVRRAVWRLMALLGLREMSDLSPESEPKRTYDLFSPSDLAGAAYIPDMSCEDSKRARHRQRQARYEVRMRAGVALYPAPLSAIEIDAGRQHRGAVFFSRSAPKWDRRAGTCKNKLVSQNGRPRWADADHDQRTIASGF